jgi:hypothetical protein
MALTIIASHGNLATQEMEQVVHLVTAALTVTVDASLLLLCPCPSLCALHSFPVDVLVPRLRPASRVKGRVSLLSLPGLEGRAGSEVVLVLSAQATASRRVCISSDAACSRTRYAEAEKGRALAARAGQGRVGQERESRQAALLRTTATATATATADTAIAAGAPPSSQACLSSRRSSTFEADHHSLANSFATLTVPWSSTPHTRSHCSSLSRPTTPSAYSQHVHPIHHLPPPRPADPAVPL